MNRVTQQLAREYLLNINTKNYYDVTIIKDNS